jgi:hypothetical protein
MKQRIRRYWLKTGRPIHLFRPQLTNNVTNEGLVALLLDAMRHELTFVNTVLPDVSYWNRCRVISPSSVEVWSHSVARSFPNSSLIQTAAVQPISDMPGFQECSSC